MIQKQNRYGVALQTLQILLIDLTNDNQSRHLLLFHTGRYLLILLEGIDKQIIPGLLCRFLQSQQNPSIELHILKETVLQKDTDVLIGVCRRILGTLIQISHLFRSV